MQVSNINYLLTYDSYVPLYNRFHRGEWITRVSGGEGALDTPGTLNGCARDNLRGQKSLGPLKMSLEMAHKVILPPKKNYIPQFLKQRDINSYIISVCFFIIPQKYSMYIV